jgi:hypothetical protein
MKSRQSIIVILLITTFSVSLTLSCKSVKSAVSCPDISVKNSNIRVHHKLANKHELFALKPDYFRPKHQSWKIRKSSGFQGIQDARLIRVNPISKIDYINNLLASADKSFHPILISSPESIQSFSQLNPQTQDVKCDTIVLKSGAIIIGKVEEIGQNEVKYRRSNNLSGPVISVLKTEISTILYSNGTSELFGPSDNIVPTQNYNPNQKYPADEGQGPLKTEPLSIIGFSASLLGLFVASIPLGLIALILGIVSLSKIKKNPRRFKGKALAILGIIIGIIEIALMAVLLSAFTL